MWRRPTGCRVLADRARLGRPGSRLTLRASVAGLGGGISWRPTAYSLLDIYYIVGKYLIIMDARSAMRPCYILPMFFYIFFYGRQTAERIFTKLSHVVDIRCYLRTY